MVYVIYNRKDIGRVKPICEALKAKGVVIGIDIEQCASASLAEQLTGSIAAADAVLFFYSENADNSLWVRKEVEYAQSLQKLIIPVSLTEIIGQGYQSFSLNNAQWIDAVGKNSHVLANQIASLLNGDRKICNACPQKKVRAPYLNIWIVVLIAGVFLSAITVLFSRFLMGSAREPSLPSNNIENRDSLFYERRLAQQELELRYRTDELLYNFDLELYRLYNAPPAGDNRNQKLLAIHEEIKSTLGENVSLPQGTNIPTEFINEYHRQVDSILNLRLAQMRRETEYRLIAIADSTSRANTPDLIPKNTIKNEFPWMFILFAFLAGVSISLIVLLHARPKAKRAKKETSGDRVIRCFIAGSKSLQAERDALRAVISIMYNKWAAKNFRILSFTYEDFQKEHTAIPPQEQYNRFISEEADWALFIIDGKIGGITVEEYRQAMDAYKKYGKPKVLAMAKEGSESEENVAALKAEINKEHQYWIDYTDINSLKYTFESALNWSLIEMFMSPSRV